MKIQSNIEEDKLSIKQRYRKNERDKEWEREKERKRDGEKERDYLRCKEVFSSKKCKIKGLNVKRLGSKQNLHFMYAYT